jgi:hypothetical protein
VDDSTRLSTATVDNMLEGVDNQWTTAGVVHRLWTTLGIMVAAMTPGRRMTGPDDVHRLWIEDS